MSTLTPAQKTLILTVNLSHPATLPAFMHAVDSPAALGAALRAPEPGVTVWAITPNWGSLQGLFDRQKTKPLPKTTEVFTLEHAAISKRDIKQDRRAFCAILNDPRSIGFVARCRELHETFAENLGMQPHWLYAKVDHGHNDHEPHQDSGEADLRGTLALEEGSTLFFDPQDCRARGMKLSRSAFTNPSIAHFIDAGVPVYGVPFGTIVFFGSRSLAARRRIPPAWHASRLVPKTAQFSRPLVVFDYLLK